LNIDGHSWKLVQKGEPPALAKYGISLRGNARDGPGAER
jgi:hypothetical protein